MGTVSCAASCGQTAASSWPRYPLPEPAAPHLPFLATLIPPQVPDEGAYSLGAALKANTCLTELGLADNHITANGGRGRADCAFLAFTVAPALATSSLSAPLLGRGAADASARLLPIVHVGAVKH